MRLALTPEHFHALAITGGRELPGYDPFQEVISETYIVIAKLSPPDFPIEWVMVDESCGSCPINPNSERYDVGLAIELAETVVAPCNPLGVEMSGLNRLLLKVYDREYGRAITAGDLLLGLPESLAQPLTNTDFWIPTFESVRGYTPVFNELLV